MKQRMIFQDTKVQLSEILRAKLELTINTQFDNRNGV